MTTYVPDINDDCIKETISYTFLSICKFQAAHQNIISNQIRSQIRRVHGTKHHETKYSPTDQILKTTKNIQKQFTAIF